MSWVQILVTQTINTFFMLIIQKHRHSLEDHDYNTRYNSKRIILFWNKNTPRALSNRIRYYSPGVYQKFSKNITFNIAKSCLECIHSFFFFICFLELTNACTCTCKPLVCLFVFENVYGLVTVVVGINGGDIYILCSAHTMHTAIVYEVLPKKWYA